MKTCYICKITKPESGFHHDASRKDGLSNKCRLCEDKRRLERLGRLREHYRLLTLEPKRKGCYICGEKDPLVLDMHHKEGKVFGISNITATHSRVIPPLPVFLKELKKCIPLCANCHRRVTRGAIKL